MGNRKRTSDARVYHQAITGLRGSRADHELLVEMDEATQLTSWPGPENRAFLVRAVSFLAEQGIDQFLDVGAGLPAWGNVHEVARRLRPGAAVAYVDKDPEVVAEWREVAAEEGPMCSVRGDVRRPAEILANPEVRAVIDFDRPVGLLLAAVLHVVDAAEEHGKLVRTLTGALAPGSYLVLSTFSDEEQDPEPFELVRRIVLDAGGVFTVCSRQEIVALFDGLELVDPGVVMVPDWRPVRPTSRPAGWIVGGVARKP